jgi:TP901 family phage tail tape measure protein
MSSNLTLALRLLADSSGLQRGLTQASQGVKRFTSFARDEVNALKASFNSLTGRLASLGVSLSVAQQVMKSAKLDQSLTQIGQTAGASKAQVTGLRAELFRMATQTGKNVEDLQQGFNNLVQSGMSWDAASSTIKDINIAMAVTGAGANTLSGALGVAAQAFDFDLSKPGMALQLLDKMTVAGRLGNAELEGLSDVFARIGVNAKAAGMNFDQTLAFTETLSLVERAPERLATLADSTLRLFTNANYRKEATKATGVQFFNKDKSARDPSEVFRDLKAKYDKLSSDQDRATFMSAAFGKADLDTQKGLRTLFSGDMLTKSKEFGQNITGASGTLKKDIAEALNNAVSQVGRVKSAMRNAADEFAKPINETLANVIQWAMDKKENGGLGLDGKDMILGGAGLAASTFAAARYGSMAIKAAASKFGGLGAGVATGKGLESAAGVMPVYVVNMPADGLAGNTPGIPGVPSAAGNAAKAAPLVAASIPVVMAAGVAISAYKAYEGFQRLSEGMDRIDADNEARKARRADMEKKLNDFGGEALVNSTKTFDFQQLEKLLMQIAGAKQQPQEINLHLDGEQIATVVNNRNARTASRN